MHPRVNTATMVQRAVAPAAQGPTSKYQDRPLPVLIAMRESTPRAVLAQSMDAKNVIVVRIRPLEPRTAAPVKRAGPGRKHRRHARRLPTESVDRVQRESRETGQRALSASPVL